VKLQSTKRRQASKLAPPNRSGGLLRAGSNLDILHLSAISMTEQRLGDVIDDHCVKCRRITNHSIVSLVNGQAAKVRCRTCYHDHDYRHEQAPPSKKDLKRAEAEAALAAQNGNPGASPASPEKRLKKASAPEA
jgi:hypothetical protein